MTPTLAPGRSRRRAALAVALALAWPVGAAAQAAAPASPTSDAFRLPIVRVEFGPAERVRCLACHGGPDLEARVAGTGALRALTVDPVAFDRSVHGPVPCTGCHVEIRSFPHRFEGARPPVSCDADCHARDPRGRPVRHDRELADYRRSVHGRGLSGNDPDRPSCLGCHGGGDAHAIAAARGQRSRAEQVALCEPCHDDHLRMTRDRVNPAAAAAFNGSVHGRTLRLGSTRAAACQDCHGVHLILAARDTASTIAPAHLARTCGQARCHEGTSSRFAAAGMSPTGLGVRPAPVLARERRFFETLTGMVLAVLGAGVVLDLQRRLWRSRRAPVEPTPGPLIRRLSTLQLVQHGTLVASFTVLALTGLPLRYPGVPALAGLAGLLGGPEALRVAHRVAAVALMLDAALHLGYALLLLRRAGGHIGRAWPMLPTRRDAREWWQATRYYLGLRPTAPAHGRHHFREKVHYLAVLWGVPLMVLSGLALWFPVHVVHRLPPLALGVVGVAHGDEAMLAIAVVLIWHFYNVFVMPGPGYRFRTWLDGRITREEWLELHRLEAEGPAAREDPGA